MLFSFGPGRFSAIVQSMIRGALLDIAGALYDGDTAIEGSAEASNSRQLLFFTNYSFLHEKTDIQ
ncbi:MAG: hypothetical protein OXC72_14425 [Roseovarius sp.]|nr:hypothetical protein [Roseovarius sp.]